MASKAIYTAVAAVGIAAVLWYGGHQYLDGHLTIGDGAIATAQTGIPGSVEPGAVVSGYDIRPAAREHPPARAPGTPPST
mgnify:CR=1 FL=1